MDRCQHSFLKNPSNLCIGSNSFQGIYYAGKPQAVSSYFFKSVLEPANLAFLNCAFQYFLYAETELVELRVCQTHIIANLRGNLAKLAR
jgi:hypothetical protein